MIKQGFVKRLLIVTLIVAVLNIIAIPFYHWSLGALLLVCVLGILFLYVRKLSYEGKLMAVIIFGAVLVLAAGEISNPKGFFGFERVTEDGLVYLYEDTEYVDTTLEHPEGDFTQMTWFEYNGSDKQLTTNIGVVEGYAGYAGEALATPAKVEKGMHHLAVVYDGNFSVYLDGELKGSKQMDADDRIELVEIDDYRYYNRAMSGEEIKEIYKGDWKWKGKTIKAVGVVIILIAVMLAFIQWKK
ncbi:MAG: hypothetical protein ACOCZ6_06115 [Nanoarchaeota archaeon]